MKNLLKLSLVGILLLSLSNISFAQKKKKVKRLEATSKILPFSADKVWAILAEDYGAVAKSHPKIIKSNYINGSLKGGEGAERVCYFNKKETRYLKEKMIEYNPENYTFTNTIFQAGKFPVDPENTLGLWKVVPQGLNSSQIVFKGTFRTKPAFMGGMMKRSFKKLITDYFIAIEHHLATGESVTKENFKSIKKHYAAR